MIPLVGVVDLAGGRAVHARAGARAHYAPVETAGGTAIAPGDAIALARAYVDRLGVRELYVADLDAILGLAPQDEIIERLAAIGAPLWVDQGVGSVEQATRTRRLGATRIVVGLETLPSYGRLDDICGAAGGVGVAFSLDLRDGQPITAGHWSAAFESPEAHAVRAAEAGAGAVIVIDLARVGTGSGPDVALVARIRRAVPHVQLLAGGGVRDTGDLRRLAGAGVDGALIATALQTGAIGRAPEPHRRARIST